MRLELSRLFLPSFNERRCLRCNGLAFDKEEKQCVILEYTRAMDTTEDWAEKKEQEKNDRYSSY